jgi:hypothetical protein
MYTYSDELFSDFHKDAYGFRPRDHEFYSATPDRKQEIWDATGRQLDRTIQEEAEMADKAVATLEAEIAAVISAGAPDRSTALRWMTEDTKFCSLQDVEHWVWNQGVLFTDYGKKLVDELKEVD